MNFVSTLPQVTKEEYDAFQFEVSRNGNRFAISFKQCGSLCALRVNLNQNTYENEVTEERVTYCIPCLTPHWKKNKQKVLMSTGVAVFVEQGANNFAWGFGDVDHTFQEENNGKSYDRIRILKKKEWAEGEENGGCVEEEIDEEVDKSEEERGGGEESMGEKKEEKGEEERRTRRILMSEEEAEEAEKDLFSKRRRFSPSSKKRKEVSQVRYKNFVWGSQLEVKWVQLFENIGFQVSKGTTFFPDLNGEMKISYTPDIKLIGVGVLDEEVNVHIDIKPFERADKAFFEKCEHVSCVHREYMLLLEGQPSCPQIQTEDEYWSYPKVKGMKGTLWVPGQREPVHNVVLMKEGSRPPFFCPLTSSSERRHMHSFLLHNYRL